MTGLFLDDPKRLVLVSDWNVILDPKLDKAGWGTDRCNSSLIDLLTEHDLVNLFRLDQPGQEMWMWLIDLPSAQIQTNLDRVLVRRADSNFVMCPTFHCIGQTDPYKFMVSLQLANRPSLAGYWKFNTSLLEIGDFRDQLETLIQWALVWAVTRNKWWGSLKYRIKDFAI